MPTIAEPQTSFYSSLSTRIRAAIVENGRPGDKVISERDLAKQFGVSTVTVARVLRDLQAAGLIERVKGKGTFLRGVTHNGSAHVRHEPPRDISIVQRSASRLQVVILAGLAPIDDETPVSELWDYHAATGAERAMQKQGHVTHTVNAYDGNDKVIAELDETVSGGVNGFVVIGKIDLPILRRVLSFTDRAAQNPVKAVQVIWDESNDLPFDSVGFDGEAGVYMATRHLLETGHKDIRFMAPGWFDRRNLPYWVRDRLQGFYRALTEAGVSDVLPADVMWGNLNYSGVEFGDAIPIDGSRWRATGQEMWNRLSSGQLPDAVVAINDQMARAFIEAARADGASVPGDISVIGYDDRYDSAAFGLTTVHVAVQEIGETAAMMLLEQIASPTTGRRTRVSLTPSLVVRKSTRI
ncbi:MAG TPA: LacI family DNA-binding transcriptional regulator [Capsulimonadaceae bacterium]|jgi:DNA-binding LacI/PurR family transcriptional regulator/DNA-binding transcriptional regulator YhcF (GntR family)